MQSQKGIIILTSNKIIQSSPFEKIYMRNKGGGEQGRPSFLVWVWAGNHPPPHLLEVHGDECSVRNEHLESKNQNIIYF